MLVKERVGEGTRFSNNEFELDFSTSESELIVHMIDLLSSNQDIYPVIDLLILNWRAKCTNLHSKIKIKIGTL